MKCHKLYCEDDAHSGGYCLIHYIDSLEDIIKQQAEQIERLQSDIVHIRAGYEKQIERLEKLNTSFSYELKTYTELNTNLKAENKRKAEQIGKLSASLELALNQQKIDKAENKRLKEEVEQLKKDIEINNMGGL